MRRVGSGDADVACAASLAIVGKSASRERMAAALADGTVFFVAYDDDEPVGFVYGHPLPRVTRDGTALLLYEMEVREPRRRRGIGRALLVAFEGAARDIGADAIWLLTNESNPAAMALYESAGFDRPNEDDAMWVRKLGDGSGPTQS